MDYCPGCGVWLDAFEIDALMAREGATAPKLEHAPDVKESRLDCPRCRAPMKKVRHAATGVILDECEANCGLWLDRNEFEQILASHGKGEGPLAAFLGQIFAHSTEGSA